jgi:hypothetical protein
MARVELQSATGGAKIAVTFVGRGAEPGDAAFAYRLERL